MTQDMRRDGEVAAADGGDALLRISDLHVSIPQRKGMVNPLRGVDLSLEAGRTIGIVGESGSGKTMTSLAIMGLLPGTGRVTAGSIEFDGTDLMAAGAHEARRRRGSDIGMIFQDPMSSLNPTMTIGEQVGEGARFHERLSRRDARDRAVEILDRVGMPRPESIARDYPHQLSGGMRQRAMIAMALVNHPKLLIADEPTTALDVTTQRQILDLIEDIQEEFGSAAILVTHDLGVVAGRADDVAVMYAGRVVEQAPAARLFADPAHQYTRALLAALPERAVQGNGRLYAIPGMPPNLGEQIEGCPFAPRCHRVQDDCLTGTIQLERVGGEHVAACLHPGGEEIDALSDASPVTADSAGLRPTQTPAERGTDQVVLEVDGATKQYPALGGSIVRRRVGSISAVSEVSFSVRAGETFGLVGESGCGKSTLGRLVAMLETPTSGSVRLDGAGITGLKGRQARSAHRRVQMMFQDSTAAMDPRMRVDEILTEPLDIQKVGTARSRTERAEDLVADVGLADDALERYPHEFSGGQLQRVGLARSLALDPRLVVCDEPVSALDVSVQAQVLNLMKDIQAEHDLAYLFISHDLSVVSYLSDRIGVMYLGHMVEQGPAEEVSSRPRHPYTRVLIDAVPTVEQQDDRERLLVEGELPSAADPPSGCRFRTRCPFAQEICATAPPVHEFGSGDASHTVACHFPLPADGTLPVRAEAST
ncbi:MAG: ABC transporter ATP-binding protein [Brachybacterium sp.]|uniref:dipeptide ABC transporter ATP-binding protein n=1 Tax=Brachybacterium sp. TaxID=1891286 RepID=UPI00264735DE|nr:ABC transporter ATP-binding protein [Brachybacterium sp.]MDN5686437.1 ABC transporter ATP-binding protein [Brachybacterium sp.]